MADPTQSTVNLAPGPNQSWSWDETSGTFVPSTNAATTRAEDHFDLDTLYLLAKDAGHCRWHAGHFADNSHPCNCEYLFDDGHLGGIARINVDNGLQTIREGANCCPEPELAKANLRFMAAANPAVVIALINEIKRLSSAQIKGGQPPKTR